MEGLLLFVVLAVSGAAVFIAFFNGRGGGGK